jgi:Family of unknown function (DUF6789)
MTIRYKKILLSLLALLAAAISPNLFVVAQAGYALLSDLAISFLIPSIIFLALIITAGYFIGEKETSRQITNGIIGGMIATIGLEIVREIGFHLGGMPGDMPKLMGVLLLNQFSSGPDLVSNIAGWSYHFWNGASFGIIYSVLAGKGKVWYGLVYGILIGIGFMMSPVVVALGVGHFGVDFGIGFPVTVILAHIAFGLILGWFIKIRNKPDSGFIKSIRIR